MKCFIYRNLHKAGYVYSIKALEGPYTGRVVAHASHVDLVNVEFRISKSGRARYEREGVRNVHAGIVGDVLGAVLVHSRLPCAFKGVGVAQFMSMPPQRVTYNPKKYVSFVLVDSEESVHEAHIVEIAEGAVSAFSPR